MAKEILQQAQRQAMLERLRGPNQETLDYYRGERGDRQPVHTVYGGAHLFKSATTQRIGEMARQTFAQYARTPAEFAAGLGLPMSPMMEQVHARVGRKLAAEAVEDFRIDFEDGYGYRPDAEEDETAVQAAAELAMGMANGTISPFTGIRIKSLSEENKRRSIRTLDIFLATLLDRTGGKLPPGFVVTLPKITHPQQVAVFCEILMALESKSGLPADSLLMEMMIETPQSVFHSNGHVALYEFVRLAGVRCRGAHFGTYDYTASVDITADQQVMDHPACDFARHVMKVALAGTGIFLSDGATNVMPIGPHKEPKSEQEWEENRRVVHRAWALSCQHVTHSLRHAYYQGWDLHPAQLPVRYGALYAFFLQGLASASNRLTNFIDKAAKATLVGDVFDDAATGQGLLNYFLRALNCGAITEQEVLATGLTLAEVQGKSFMAIVENRRERH